MSDGFASTDFMHLMDPKFELTGYGSVEWVEVNGMSRGTFAVAVPYESYPLRVEPMIMLRPRRPDEPTYLLNVNGVLAIRVDINQLHRFRGESAARRTSHVQSHPYGSSAPQTTTEITDSAFPTVSSSVNLGYEAQIQSCFSASARLLNMNVDAVDLMPLPFHPGGEYR